MSFLKSLTFAHWSFLVAIIATIATLIGSFVSLKKDLDQAKEDKEIEVRRQTEYDSLLTRSIEIQRASNTLVKKADSTLSQQLDILLKQNDALKKATSQLNKTELVLQTQSSVIRQQVETIKQLTGGDGVPTVLISVGEGFSDILYPVSVYLKNTDDYPIQNVEFEIDDPIFRPYYENGSMTKAQSDAITEAFHKRKDAYLPQFTLPPHTTKLVHRTVLKFDPLKDSDYGITVNWLKGSYKLIIPKTTKDYIPIFGEPDGFKNRKPIPAQLAKSYLEIETFIKDPQKQTELMRARVKEVKEIFEKMEKKRD